MTSTARPRPRAVLLGVQLPGVSDVQLESSLGELRRLAKTLGIDVVGRVTQKRPRLAPGAVVGEGKLKELAEFTGGTGVVPVGPPAKRRDDARQDEAEADAAGAEETARDAGDQPGGGDRASGDSERPRADLVLVNHELSPSQSRNLERATSARVLDRTAVILAIFQHHARSREARLQVEIARLGYDAPRLRETSGGQDRQSGHVGGRGAGESALEIDRRKVRDRIAELRAELEQIEREARTRRQRRGGMNTVALVGYTNAGKSSWMRALTGSGVLVEDKLFATLDTTVRALTPEVVPRVLVSDTVGFIDQLPHALVASFRSTLDEARNCELLVHLADASDGAFPNQIRVTRDVLESISATESPHLLVLNKIDKVDEATRERLAAEWPEALQLSVRDPADVATLRERIVAFFERDMVEAELLVPYAQQRIVAEAHAGARVLDERHDEVGTRLRVRATPETLERLRASLEKG